jgi:uncharacterized protein (DUF2141 family)
MEARTVFFAVALMMGSMAAVAAAAEECAGQPGPGLAKLAVVTDGVRTPVGNIVVTIYPDDPSRFLAKHGKVAKAVTPARSASATSCFWLAEGTYAVAVYHDANGNRHFDRTLTGPAEGYGFSNDAPAVFGLPSFKATRVRMGADKPIHIKLRYP